MKFPFRYKKYITDRLRIVIYSEIVHIIDNSKNISIWMILSPI